MNVESGRVGRHLEVICHLSRELARHLDLSEVLSRTLELLVRSLNATGGSIAVIGNCRKVLDASMAVGGSIIPCSSLILLSDAMLRVSPKILASHQLTCVILCFGLSGIAVGLGAKMPSLREQSPSRIAAGFGGTLNLVFSTLYIILVVLLTAVPVQWPLKSLTLRIRSAVPASHSRPARRRIGRRLTNGRRARLTPLIRRALLSCLAARGESQAHARARDFSPGQGAEPQTYWSISRILQRRDGGKDPLAARLDFCHGLLGAGSPSKEVKT